MTWGKCLPLSGRLWSPRLPPAALAGKTHAVLRSPAPASHWLPWDTWGRGRGRGAVGGARPQVWMSSLRTLACGPNGHSSAGPLATAEAGGAAGAGGCGEPPGAGALGTARWNPWVGPQWASRLPAALSGRRPVGSRPRPLVGRSPGWAGPE